MDAMSLGNIEEQKEEEKKDALWKDNPIKPAAVKNSAKQGAAQTTQQSEEESKLEYIPCLFLPIDDGARKLIIYFHGNAEDIGLAYDFLY